MTTYNETKTFSFGNLSESRVLIVDGGLNIESKIDDKWIQTDSLITGAYVYYTKGVILRLTPSQNSSYSIDED